MFIIHFPLSSLFVIKVFSFQLTVIEILDLDFDQPQIETLESCCKTILSLKIDGNFKF